MSFHALFDAAANALLLADETDHVIAANQAAQRLLGYDAEEVCGLQVEMLIVERDRSGYLHYRRDFSSQPEQLPISHEKELVALCRDGREIPVDISLRRLHAQGLPCNLITLYDASGRRKAEDALRISEERLLGIMQDMTEHRASERRLRDRRSERESLLSQQVAIQTATAIAHELNQPLAAVSAYSEVALHELANFDCPEKLRRALHGCAEQAQRAGQALHELLEFLQKGDVVAAPMDINESVRDAIAFALNDGFDGFHHELHLEQNMPPVLANRIQVQRILTNLIRNGVEAARDAGMSGTAITIRVQTAEEAGMAQVTVQDNGPGLDAEWSGRIFDPFFTTKPRGIGMGLAISRALAKANGGRLWVDPAAGPGATFHFTLPFAS